MVVRRHVAESRRSLTSTMDDSAGRSRRGMRRMGPRSNKPAAGRSGREQAGSTASEAIGLHGTELLYCRQCAAWVAVSATRELSTHPTSGGLVTYFRCSSGHADFNRTSTAPTSSGQEYGNGDQNGHEPGERP